MDTEAFRETFVGMRAQVQRYAARRCPREAAEEVVAETFAALWSGRARAPEEPDELRAWVFGIARRQLAQIQRKDRRVQELGSSVREAVLAGVPVVGPDPATQVVEADSARRVHGQLSHRDQEILQLVCWAGLPVEQVAGALGLSPSTVRTRLSRARERLVALVLADDRSTGVPAEGSTARSASVGDLVQRLGYVHRPDEDKAAGRGGPSDDDLFERLTTPVGREADPTTSGVTHVTAHRWDDDGDLDMSGAKGPTRPGE